MSIPFWGNMGDDIPLIKKNSRKINNTSSKIRGDGN